MSGPKALNFPTNPYKTTQDGIAKSAPTQVSYELPFFLACFLFFTFGCLPHTSVLASITEKGQATIVSQHILPIIVFSRELTGHRSPSHFCWKRPPVRFQVKRTGSRQQAVRQCKAPS